jgi:hypothetical protein
MFFLYSYFSWLLKVDLPVIPVIAFAMRGFQVVMGVVMGGHGGHGGQHSSMMSSSTMTGMTGNDSPDDDLKSLP